MTFNDLHEGLARTIESSEKKLRWFLRRYRLRKSVKQYLTKPYRLSRAQKKEAKNYWKKYAKHFSSLWHELFLQKTGNFDPRYVPDDIMFTEIEDYLNDWNASHGLDNKCNYDLLFPDVLQPRTLFRKMRGDIYRDANWKIISKEEVLDICKKEGCVVTKTSTEVGYGGGVKFWDSKNQSIDDLEKIIDTLPGDLIGQAVITQHSELQKLKSNSVHRIRVVTLGTRQGIEYICGYFRMGQGTEKVDYKGGCVCSIYPDGQLYEIGYDNGTCNQIRKHSCGVAFKDYKIPEYKKVVEAAKKCHEKIGSFRIISWDFSVSTDGEPIFIEMNASYGGIMYHQLGMGPLFGDKTEQILDEVFNKKRK